MRKKIQSYCFDDLFYGEDGFTDLFITDYETEKAFKLLGKLRCFCSTIIILALTESE